MAKWYGKIGFGFSDETEPGIFNYRVEEKNYRGEIMRSTQINKSSNEINDGLVMSIKLKVIAEPFIRANLSRIIYILMDGVRWKVTSLIPEYPHVTLEIGDVYNGQTPY